ncbi:DUF2207 family protein [Bogoriella caseilytica]|uniref:Putative membrane protein DUF2207 n=1 Tax=Bogoriella caseilytica TaxID=56055 RepID=A0A3N2BGE5_9MICO|nr:DUF2207 domain-containing protein [Bogoriella caseilytica]ROR74329.1 putative membrane protein DUF2207 [Bogoriella caseilytica]
MRRRAPRLLATLALGLAIAGLSVTASADEAESEAPDEAAPTIRVELMLDDEGLLAVTERITVPVGMEVSRDQPLRQPAGEAAERVYTVENLSVSGAGAAEADGDSLTATAPEGETEIAYTVTGAVAQGPDEQTLTWYPTGWWNGEIGQVTAAVLAPTPRMALADCRSGAPESAARCTLAALSHSGILEIDQRGLDAGHRIEIVVGLPDGTVPVSAQWDEVMTLSRALSMTLPAALAFAGLAALVVLASVSVAVTRRRDLAALESGHVDSIIAYGEKVDVVTPHNIPPGQAGTLIDASVDPVDLAAATVGLAVRGHLHFAEVRDHDDTVDWVVSRGAGDADALRPYEQTLVAGLAPDEQARPVSSLGEATALDLGAVRGGIYGEIFARGWFADRTARGWPTWIGGALIMLGFVGGVALALTIGHALIGVATIGAGVLVLLAPRFLPLRTGLGSQAAGEVIAMRHHLHLLAPEGIPEADRELVFSRGLPYAVVLGETKSWLEKFSELAPAANGEPGVAWFGGFENSPDLGRFAKHFPHFLAELEGVFATTDHVATLQPSDD